jgi:Domain of unknown function (DUF4258)
MSMSDDAIFSAHAITEMERRGIDEAQVREVLANPGLVAAVRPGREVLTSLLQSGPNEHRYVLRVFVDVDRIPPVVVTVYRSSKIAKYWSQP